MSPQVTETLHTSAELVAAGIAADNLVVSLYFAVLFAVAGQPRSNQCMIEFITARLEWWTASVESMDDKVHHLD
jgi:uncharacterized membrane protein